MLDSLVKAGIKTESPVFNSRPGWIIRALYKTGMFDENTGIGPAKVSDKQMVTSVGEDADGKIGLGMCTSPCDKDQNDADVAYDAMEIRISLRLDVCVQHGCTETDMVIVALLAADERITPNYLDKVFGIYESDQGDTKIDWERYFEVEWPDKDEKDKNHDLLNIFPDALKKNKPRDFPDVKWKYIEQLAQAQ